MTPARPALTDVLAALTGRRSPPLSAVPWHEHDVSLDLPWGAAATSTFAGEVVPFGVARWVHGGPAEALEALQTAGLAPPDGCGRCGSRSARVTHDARPVDVPSLVAVASLGAGPWLRAEGLAREVFPRAHVAWRAATARGLAESHESTLINPHARHPAVLAFASAARQGLPPDGRWPALDELRRMGVHLVHGIGLGPRVTLAVERIGESL